MHKEGKVVRVQIVKETCAEIGDGWALCFQWCRYFFDEGNMLYGYRFIQRRPNGGVHAVRGQTRIPSLEMIEGLTTVARNEGWGDYDAKRMSPGRDDVEVYDKIASGGMRRWRDGDVDELADCLRQLPSVPKRTEAANRLDCPAAKVLDCVLSLNRRYKTFVVPRIDEFRKNHPNVRTLAELDNLVKGRGGEGPFFRNELDYYDDSRAISFGNVLTHMRSVSDAREVSIQLEELKEWADKAQAKGYRQADIDGFGIAGWQYMRMLFGADTLKPDRHIVRYVEGCLGKRVSRLTAVELMEAAAPRAAMSVREADRRIWRRATDRKVADGVAKRQESESSQAGTTTGHCNKYKDWYPMEDKEGTKGAYTWLSERGYGKAAKAIKVASAKDFGLKSATYCRRRITIGLVYKMDLVDDFLETLWTQQYGDPQYRRERMDDWYDAFRKHPEWEAWLDRTLKDG
jgi:hypothetical protein